MRAGLRHLCQFSPIFQPKAPNEESFYWGMFNLQTAECVEPLLNDDNTDRLIADFT